MVRLNELISKISEARTLYSPYGEKNAIIAFRTAHGQYIPTDNAAEREQNDTSFGRKNTTRSNSATNVSTLQGIATTISGLVSRGRIAPRRSDKDLLNRRTRITEEKLRVFDFDDTLATSKSKVTIINKKTGKKRKITPGQYAKYKPKPHETPDFSEFDHVIKPKRVKEIHSIIKRLSKKKRSFMILTARGNKAKKPIRKYLEKEGLFHPERVRITTVGSSDPQAKSKVIAKHLNTGKYTHVEFFDDSGPNVEAVASLKDTYPHIKIRSRQIHYAERKK